MKKVALWLEETVNNPNKVLLICLGFMTLSLVSEGSLWRIYRLHKDKSQLNQKIEEEKFKIIKLGAEIKRLDEPQYVERQAREKLELLEKDDLLFIFSGEKNEAL
jgi:cell division protein FtsB